MARVLFASLGSTVAMITIAPLTAQAARWQLPPHGVVLYDERTDITATDLGKADARGQRTAGIPDSQATVPLVFGDELEGGGACFRGEPWSLPTLALWLACDLSTWSQPGPIDRRWPRVTPYGEVRFQGEAAAVADGWQEIRGTLSRRDAPACGGAAAGDSAAEFERHDQWLLAEQLDGRLTLRRAFDAQRGVVRAFTWTIDAVVTRRVGEQHQRASVQGSTTWTLREVLECRWPARGAAPDFAARVAAASEAAAAQQSRLLAEGSNEFLCGGERRGSVTGPSLHALMLLGLARQGHRIGDPGIVAEVQALLRRPQTEAHGLALTILALAALCAPANERQALLAGEEPVARALPRELRAPLALLCRRLHDLAGRGTGGQADTLWWPFAGDTHEYSGFHTWIAVLACDAATRCGVQVPEVAFARMAAHLLAAAMPAGPARAMMLCREDVRPSERRTTAAPASLVWTDRPWSHAGFGDGAETAGAMAALLACRRHLRDAGRIAAIDAAVAGGWNWLGAHWTPRHAPTVLAVQRQHRPEFVLAMSFLLDATAVRWLDDRDVYFELASVLLHEQRGDGCVPPTVLDTAAALSLWRPWRAAVTGSGGTRAPAK